MLKVDKINISPEVAKRIMNGNTQNFRAINPGRVNRYAREMSAGLWQENGEAIQIYEDGTLANGQHRLAAIIKSGITLPMIIVTGVKKDVTTYDRPYIRTIGQIAKARGTYISSRSAGACAMMMFGRSGSQKSCGQDEVLEYYDRNPMLKEIEDILSHGAKNGILRKAPCLAAMYCAYLLGIIGTDGLDQFSRIVNSGLPEEGIVSNAPLCLRNSMTKKTRFSEGHGMEKVALFEITYQALEDFTKQVKRKLAYKPDGRCTRIIEAAKIKAEQVKMDAV